MRPQWSHPGLSNRSRRSWIGLGPTRLLAPRTIVGMWSWDRAQFNSQWFVRVLRFETEEEVIKLANDTNYGLAAGIFTRDGARSLRVARATRAGIVWINTYRVVSPIAEFGGFKDSGYGRESGFQAIYDYTRQKTVWINTSSEPMTNPFVMR